MKSNAQYKQTEFGEITEDWTLVELKKVVTTVVDNRGKTPPTQSYGIDLLEVNAVVKGEKFPDYNKVRKYVSSDTYSDWFRAGHPQINDILVPTVGTIGNAAIMKESRGSIAQNLIALRVDKNIADPHFVYYLLTSPEIKQKLLNLNIGGVQPSIKVPHLLKLKVAIPRFTVQHQIASILSSLDDKIELNRKMNKTLEEIGKALFKRWFVDFEFPNENREPYKSSGGEMVDSELGVIPKGWEVKSLDEIADVSIGRTPPRLQKEWFSINPKDIKWISIKDMGNAGVYIGDTSEYLTREAIQKFKIPLIPTNTVIVSFKLTVGRVAITTEEMLSNEAIAHIKTKHQKLSAEYIYLSLKNFDFSSLGTTSSIATAVNSKSIKAIQILIPQKTILDQCNTLLTPIFRRILVNYIEVTKLEVLRDSLLPRLMSGKIRVN